MSSVKVAGSLNAADALAGAGAMAAAGALAAIGAISADGPAEVVSARAEDCVAKFAARSVRINMTILLAVPIRFTSLG